MSALRLGTFSEGKILSRMWQADYSPRPIVINVVGFSC
jgi:hypothetical protein